MGTGATILPTGPLNALSNEAGISALHVKETGRLLGHWQLIEFFFFFYHCQKLQQPV